MYKLATGVCDVYNGAWGWMTYKVATGCGLCIKWQQGGGDV